MQTWKAMLSFPVIDKTQWQLISEDSRTADAKHAYAYHFQLWKKNK
jgi:dihydrofolate reductase